MKHFENRVMLLAWGLGLFLQLIVTEVPWLVQAFGTVRLERVEWLYLTGLAAVPLLAHELLLIRLPKKKIRR